MPSYKLTYFSGRGFAEATRMLFAQAGVEYEDVRMTQESWPALKATGKAPFGQLPILEVDGQVISQSVTIMRFVAVEHGLAPSSTLERAQADMIVDAIKGDLLPKFIKMYYEKEEQEKENLKKEIYVFLPQQLKYFENILATNDKGYFVGGKLSYADIYFFTSFNNILVQGNIETPKEFADFPRVSDLYNRVMNLPNIDKWLKTRPQSQF